MAYFNSFPSDEDGSCLPIRLFKTEVEINLNGSPQIYSVFLTNVV